VGTADRAWLNRRGARGRLSAKSEIGRPIGLPKIIGIIRGWLAKEGARAASARLARFVFEPADWLAGGRVGLSAGRKPNSRGERQICQPESAVVEDLSRLNWCSLIVARRLVRKISERARSIIDRKLPPPPIGMGGGGGGVRAADDLSPGRDQQLGRPDRAGASAPICIFIHLKPARQSSSPPVVSCTCSVGAGTPAPGPGAESDVQRQPACRVEGVAAASSARRARKR
jgi:hypothetical protein